MRRIFFLLSMLIVLSLLLLGFGSVQTSSAIPLRTTQETPTPTVVDQPQPLLVWMMVDPWQMVIGSDSPRFALYEDGLVIYYDEAEEGYLSVQLNPDELIAPLPVEAFFDLEDYYEATFWTDQPSHVLFVRQGAEVKIVSVYGDLTQPDELEEPVPPSFMDIYEQVSTFTHQDAVPWLPEKVEIIMWEAEGHDEEAAAWPERWPGLDDPSTVERDSGIGSRMVSIYLPSADYEEFLSIMQDSGGRAVLDGTDWYVSYRFPFPQEHWWMQPE